MSAGNTSDQIFARFHSPTTYSVLVILNTTQQNFIIKLDGFIRKVADRYVSRSWYGSTANAQVLFCNMPSIITKLPLLPRLTVCSPPSTAVSTFLIVKCIIGKT